MAEKRVLLKAKPMNPNISDPFGDKTKLPENAGIIILSLLETEPSKDFYMTSHPVGEKYKDKAMLNDQSVVYGALITVQASELTDIEHYRKYCYGDLLVMCVANLYKCLAFC
ncbi:hypothetical protein AVEN_70461-1 [Araneus ventricosus]|uniref:Uncharacterized protein n=1 Tax=Araneus ventricosus TaxID=182803 RepID=A0A4Y2X693_ARAVE|nr:hypothetical protein AVEN_70461-1 [Araneus ventricosus]